VSTAAEDAIQGHRGVLVSVEGISGTGKTFLTRQLLSTTGAAGLDSKPVVAIDEFSTRLSDTTTAVDQQILRALADDGDYFLRAGRPRSETLLLLAVKMYDYEQHSLPALRRGHVVIEGRSLDSVAVYQSLILHANDPTLALPEARTILATASQWRPLPDLTILITDDTTAAIERAERRDGNRFTDEQRHLHAQAAALFAQLAAERPSRFHVLDRRHRSSTEATADMAEAIHQRLRRSSSMK
jgi:dTMP kinase